MNGPSRIGKQRTRLYKNRWFAKLAIREGINDATLVAAIDQANRGLVDAYLGSGLIKQRVAREGGGKSGGYRTLVFFRHEERAIFAFGFAKSDKANPACCRLDGHRDTVFYRTGGSAWNEGSLRVSSSLRQ
ncbi:type II toxin-antitoxin system RelE/ParE family toxin [Croceicoccus pelagius]|uniref:type II toxin-antitoxin system RelE/ParE family toxin n=1 Tax=Croceicoccus pelagius TaxID=1703341 RepID=UPI0027E5A38E|nr:type II toxin-antitoxin system RelE/ParE family toxin [Croceicoccus pelagius]